MRMKFAWCFFCDKRVWYGWSKTFKTYYHGCPKFGGPVVIGIGRTKGPRRKKKSRAIAKD